MTKTSLLLAVLLSLAGSASHAFAQPPCPYNETDYLNYNPDIYAAVARGSYPNGNAHYIASGYAENRRYNSQCYNGGANPSAASPSKNYPCDFNEQDYLAFNQDIYAAVQRGNYSSGRDHFIAAGYAENRRINQYCDWNGPVGAPRPRPRPRPPGQPTPRPQPPAPPQQACVYNEQDYLEYNKDIFAAVKRGSYSTGKDHYIASGFSENRRFNRDCRNGGADFSKNSPSSATPCPFNEEDYLAYNQDVYAAVQRGNYSTGLQHFIASGYAEDRTYNRYCR